MEGSEGGLGAVYRRWVVLEPTIFLFLVSGRMAYFTRCTSTIAFTMAFTTTRANLFIDVVCCGMDNMTEVQCRNLTTETRNKVRLVAEMEMVVVEMEIVMEMEMELVIMVAVTE